MPVNKSKIKPFISYLNSYLEEIDYEKVIFIYEGEINHQNILSFIRLTENKLYFLKEKHKTRKKLINILVEVLQNIFNHGYTESKRDTQLGRGAVILIRNEDSYRLISGNLIKTSNIKPVAEMLDKLSGMDTKEIREYYKQVLSNGRFSSKGGAGLGFIDMARRSDNNMQYKFVKVSNVLQFFIVEITINY
ncbi:MAG: SiaB family protein kinase [Marinilabiliales bacterium]